MICFCVKLVGDVRRAQRQMRLLSLPLSGRAVQEHVY